MYESLQAGRILELESKPTLSDGTAGGVEPGAITFDLCRKLITRKVLKKLNIPVTETEVLSVPLSNRPGAAADLCDKLSAAHINISYMYCTASTTRSGKTNVVIKVPDMKKAMKVLDSGKATRRDMKVKLRRPTVSRGRR